MIMKDDNRIRPRCTLDKRDKPARRQRKAYQDMRFLESKDVRALLILAEYRKSGSEWTSRGRQSRSGAFMIVVDAAESTTATDPRR